MNVFKFVEIYEGETLNPQTGEIVNRLWAKGSDGKEYKITSSREEVIALGSMAMACSRLILQEGEYGKFASLSRVKRLNTNLFATPVENKEPVAEGAEG